MTVGEKGGGRRFFIFEQIIGFAALEGGPKRVWVNGGGVLWKEKGASVQDFACNLEVVTIQPWLVHCGQGSTILALPSSSLLYTIIHHFSSPATQIEEVHYWRECPLGMDINVLQTLYFVFCHYCISMYSQFRCIHDILGLLLCQCDSSLGFFITILCTRYVVI